MMARRGVTGYFKDKPPKTAYGLGFQNQFTQTPSKWSLIYSTDPFIIASDSVIQMIDNHAIGDLFIRNTGAWSDQQTYFTYDSISTTGGSLGAGSGGLVVRHNGTTWATPGTGGHYLLITVSYFTGSPVFSWEMGQYTGNTVLYNFLVKASGSGILLSHGDVFKLTAVGSTFTAYQNSTVLGTYSLLSFPTGQFGMIGGRQQGGSGVTTFEFSNWHGDALNVSVPFTPAHRRGSGYYFGLQ